MVTWGAGAKNTEQAITMLDKRFHCGREVAEAWLKALPNKLRALGLR